MMEDGECCSNMVITSEFKELQDNTDDALPTATSSHFQDEPCVAVTGGHEGDDQIMSEQTSRPEIKQVSTEDEMLRLLGIVGKYLYEKNKKQSKFLMTKSYRKTFKHHNSFSQTRSDVRRFSGAKFARKKTPNKCSGKKGLTGKSVRKAFLSDKLFSKALSPPKSPTRQLSPAKSVRQAPRNLRGQYGIDKDLSSKKQNIRIKSEHEDFPSANMEAMETCLQKDEKSRNSIYCKEEERMMKMRDIFGTKEQ